jgi:hypothetical protein
MKACFVEDNEIKTLPLIDFRNKIKNGELKDIEVFDFSKDTYLNYLSNFKLPLYHSWAGIYL